MNGLGKVLFAAVVAMLLAGMLIWQGPPDSPGQPVPPASAANQAAGVENVPRPPQAPAREPKPTPGPGKEVKAPPGPGKEGKPPIRLASPAISFVEAIQIAERIGPGQAFKAERKDKPEVTFRIELVNAEGGRVKIELSGDGKVQEKEKDD